MTLHDRHTEVAMFDWRKVFEGQKFSEEARHTLLRFTHRVGEMIRNARFEDSFAQSLWAKMEPHAASELQKLKRAEASVSVTTEAQLRRFKSIVGFSDMLLNCDDDLSEIEVLSEAAQSLLKNLKAAEFISDMPLPTGALTAVGARVSGLVGDLREFIEPSLQSPPPLVSPHYGRIFGMAPAQAGVILWV